MEEMKSALMSRTIIGILITAVAFFAKAKGFDLDVPGLTDAASDLIQNVVGTGGLLLSFYGRVRATKKVSLTGAKTAALGALLLFSLAHSGCTTLNVSMNTTAGDNNKPAVKTDAQADQNISPTTSATIPLR